MSSDEKKSIVTIEEFVANKVEVYLPAQQHLQNLSTLQLVQVPFDFKQIGKLSKLKVIDIQGGRCKPLDFPHLAKCTLLERLTIKSVSLDSIDLTPLNGLTNLRTIKLIGCGLKTVILPSNPSLNDIVLDDNSLVGKYETSPPDGLDFSQLKGCLSLSYIGLKKNPLGRLDVSMFRDIGFRPKIDIRYTQLRQVYVGKAKTMPKRLGLRRDRHGVYRRENTGAQVSVKTDKDK